MVTKKSLTKGQVRKLNALRKSLGDKIAERAFAEWLKEQTDKKASLQACLASAPLGQTEVFSQGRISGSS